MSRGIEFSKVAVWGGGKSGWAAAKLLADKGAQVTLYDDRDTSVFARGGETRVRCQGGGLTVQDEELVVLSPGIRPAAPAIKKLSSAKVPYMSEIEAALLFTDTPVIAITGTDGKSTTSAMIDHVLRAAGRKSVVCGNFGIPLCEVVHEEHDLDYLVVEISAFQLWSTHVFKPVVALITNLAEDHLEYF